MAGQAVSMCASAMTEIFVTLTAFTFDGHARIVPHRQVVTWNIAEYGGKVMKHLIWLAFLLPMVVVAETPQTIQNTADIGVLEIEQAVHGTRLDVFEAAGAAVTSALPLSCVTGSSQGEIHIVGGWLSQVHVINSAVNNNHVHIRDIEIFKIASFAAIQAKPDNSTVFIQISAAFGSIQAASVCMHDLLPLLTENATVI